MFNRYINFQFFLPPISFLVCSSLILIERINLVSSAQFFKSDGIFLFPVNLIGILPIVVGLMLTIYSKRLFLKNQAEVMTFRTPTRFISSGPFRFSRNPMYLGFAIALFGIFILAGASFFSGLMVVVFILLANYWYIPYEEANMQKMFGSEYVEYKKRVRRWL